MFGSSGTRSSSSAIAAGLDLGTADCGTLVFLPGFLIAPAAYGALLAPLVDCGVRVVVPRLYHRGPRAAAGMLTPTEEALRALAVVRAVAPTGTPCHIGGHSRGGGAAWLAAIDGSAPDLAAVVLVDPVSGGGPPWARPRPLPLPVHPVPTLVVGAAIGGRCAPAGRNHEQFAAAAPHATHVVVPECGHADVLDGVDGRVGRRMCAGSRDPGAARTRVSEVVRAFVAGLG